MEIEKLFNQLPWEINIWWRYATFQMEKRKWYYRILYKPYLIDKSEFKWLEESLNDTILKLKELWYELLSK